MRVGIVVAENQAGRWDVLALPDKSVQDQRAVFKTLKQAKGLVDNGKKSVQYKRALFFDTYTKRAFFNHPPMPPEKEVM